MKSIILFAFLITITLNSLAQEKVSSKKFDDITLVNGITFFDSKFDQPRFSCGFLLKYAKDTLAITAKHLLNVIKSDHMKAVSLENSIKSWSLYPLTKNNELVITDKLLNENKAELLADKSTYINDLLVFSIKENHSKIKPLEIRTTELIPGEKLYAVGWTRKMESGEQRVYEFEFYKIIGNRILLKDVIVPELFGGLSGAPVVDENGKVVGIVSGATTEPDTKKKYFSPFYLTELKSFIGR
ncbi:trypsin-like peptidase domain-containing protein [Pedobacter frigiditerrae]|uniref:trypsin-like peptidase domain-containing protein n=1 Tax=Pedobacter frigiditerrae TaxID=2530452 RepID=UPI00292E3DD5|nr:trypsin-like peptidase domain-containing protein [Pedobacter frigiditerrae]